ncbi:MULTISPECIES: hypothetical protein [unclassified Pseudomonas]|uniref:hypothetical protein n=1 Tax=unclassified Pseudomonas TaxID=196821 RepID=UPI00244CAF44|nr:MULTISPECIES: hypothetical protein [unclassified Pseudomonas]MDG9927457.1 hypothetical protein [Pseudomonas sp. GD04042]MDH0482526.1 hypothetical protein [Pseudomonas sp. GD04015]MDH0602878.1 hypothetical protein [Pseudomonas sp. GD03869]
MTARSPVVVAYGAGTNSTALLVEMVRLGEPVDAILFADTGGERPETYAYRDLFSDWGGTFQEVGGSKNKLRGTPIGKLYVNPDFWESLMGWPIGWTGIAPLEMAKTHEWLRQHSACSQVRGDAA